MTSACIISGFGGQGVLLLGQMIAQAGLEADQQVSWIPAYGPEMRGGTAYCSVILSDRRIGSPVVETPDVLVAMNLPSMLRFEPALKPGGTMIVNASLVRQKPARTDITVISVTMNDIAAGLGNEKSVNTVGFGVVAGLDNVLEMQAAQKALHTMFGKKFADKPAVLAANDKAFLAGVSAAREAAAQ